MRKSVTLDWQFTCSSACVGRRTFQGCWLTPEMRLGMVEETSLPISESEPPGCVVAAHHGIADAPRADGRIGAHEQVGPVLPAFLAHELDAGAGLAGR